MIKFLPKRRESAKLRSKRILPELEKIAGLSQKTNLCSSENRKFNKKFRRGTKSLTNPKKKKKKQLLVKKINPLMEITVPKAMNWFPKQSNIISTKMKSCNTNLRIPKKKLKHHQEKEIRFIKLNSSLSFSENNKNSECSNKIQILSEKKRGKGVKHIDGVDRAIYKFKKRRDLFLNSVKELREELSVMTMPKNKNVGRIKEKKHTSKKTSFVKGSNQGKKTTSGKTQKNINQKKKIYQRSRPIYEDKTKMVCKKGTKTCKGNSIPLVSSIENSEQIKKDQLPVIQSINLSNHPLQIREEQKTFNQGLSHLNKNKSQQVNSANVSGKFSYYPSNPPLYRKEKKSLQQLTEYNYIPKPFFKENADNSLLMPPKTMETILKIAERPFVKEPLPSYNFLYNNANLLNFQKRV